MLNLDMQLSALKRYQLIQLCVILIKPDGYPETLLIQ